ncbi:hypothetical protein [Zavarzinella formosa]|uniref:hypothetical protein n=1 Tax=Zavarzinella formosa TaxID=360055 RepID=UPI0002FA44D9|nr:hypothetical protein [Zavarzinella formosa]
MAILTRPSFAPSTAIIYITVGALIDVWTAVYYFTYMRGATDTGNSGFWVSGLFLTGFILMAIGFFLGRIGRAARQVEMPPAEVTPQAASAEIEGARHTPIVTGGRPIIRSIPSNAVPASPAATSAPASVERTFAQ